MTTGNDDLKSSSWKLSDAAIEVLRRMFTSPDAYGTRAVGRVASALRRDKALDAYVDGIHHNYTSVKGTNGKCVRLSYRADDLKFINRWRKLRRQQYKLTTIAVIIGVSKAISDGQSLAELMSDNPSYIGDDA